MPVGTQREEDREEEGKNRTMHDTRLEFVLFAFCLADKGKLQAFC